MSQHILQQFDEQWLAEITRGEALHSSASAGVTSTGESPKTSHTRSASPTVRQWVFSIAVLIVAACALLLAQEAERRADDLQQRLAALERVNTR